MRVRLLLIAVLGGCGFQPNPYGGGQPADGRGADGPGQHDARPADAGPPLLDANCAGATGHDKDGDGIDDGCDRCPQLAAATGDSDDDGVGDACDPRPMAKDQRVLFDGFYTDENLATNWQEAQPVWMIQPTGMVAQLTALPNEHRLIYATEPFLKPYSSVILHVTAIVPNTFVGLCTGIGSMESANYNCCVFSLDGSAVPSLTSSASTAPVVRAPWPGTYAVGDEIQIVQNLATDNHCEAIQGTTTLATDSGADPTAGSFELYTASSPAAFTSVFVVEIGS